MQIIKPKLLSKLLTIIISTLLVIQPLSGSIANLQNINKSIEYEYESKNSSLGSLLTKEQKESLQKATTVSSLINAKEVNLITDDGIVLKGSQIQAQTVNMMAEYLALISDKNSESYSNFTDGSGVVIRKIINQGYVKEEAIPSTISAQDINLNGKKLLETSLNPDNILKQISSEYDLNDEQIVQIKTELNNHEWYDKTTSLSKMGMIVVQVVSTIATYGALGTAISNVSSNVMIKAAITSMVSQLGSALATSVITGNSLNVDVEKILVNSLKAAALAGVIEQIDTNLGYTGENLTYADKVSKEILHGFARASVYGGNIESILANSLGNVAFEYVGHNLYSENSQYPQIQEYIPKTLVHSIIGGTLSELAGGDFSSGAIATAVSHNVAEFIENDLLKKTVKGELSSEQSKEIIKGLSSVVSGAVVLATKENITDKELDIAQSMGASVVENNALKNFDDKLQFGMGVAEKLGQDLLEVIDLILTDPSSVIEKLSELITNIENFDINDLDIEEYVNEKITPEIADELIAKLKNIDSAISKNDIEYKGEEAKQAGKDLAEVVATLTGLVGAKGLTKAIKSDRPSWRDSEKDVLNDSGDGAREQVSYKDREEVSSGTKGSVKIDTVNGNSAIEVKNYKIENASSMISTLSNQINKRATELPENMTQKVVIDFRGQVTTAKQRDDIRTKIVEKTNGNIKLEDIEFKY